MINDGPLIYLSIFYLFIQFDCVCTSSWTHVLMVELQSLHDKFFLILSKIYVEVLRWKIKNSQVFQHFLLFTYTIFTRELTLHSKHERKKSFNISLMSVQWCHPTNCHPQLFYEGRGEQVQGCIVCVCVIWPSSCYQVYPLHTDSCLTNVLHEVIF